MTRPASIVLGTLTGIALALVLVTVAVVPFLTPAWLATGQRLANVEVLTGYSAEELERIDAAFIGDLVAGPPDFDVEVRGEPVLAVRERTHLRDVRTVFLGLFVLAIMSAIWLVVARRLAGPRRFWTWLRNASIVTIALVGAGAVITIFAFDVAFEVFHQLLFPAGTYSFDPATERLVRIFPLDFWTMTTIGVGAVLVVEAIAVIVLASLRIRAAERAVADELDAAAERAAADDDSTEVEPETAGVAAGAGEASR